MWVKILETIFKEHKTIKEVVYFMAKVILQIIFPLGVYLGILFKLPKKG